MAGAIPLMTGHVRESEIRLAGFDTRLLELQGEGPPLLLVHGFADSADTWRPILGRLASLGRAAYAIDLPGFGKASSLDLNSLILPQLDRFIAETIDLVTERAGRRAVMAGNSLGGALALRAAERDDLDLEGIVPIAPAGLSMARWLLVIESERVLNLLLRSPVPIPGPVMRAAVGRIYSTLAFSSVAAADLESVVRFSSHLDSRDRISQILEIGRHMFPELNDPFRLDRIDVPVLLIWGDRDRMVYPTGAGRVLKTVPDSRYELLEGCGHCPQLEMPDRMVELITTFPGE